MSRFSPRNIMIHMIRLYQKYISPMKRTKCPYIPTCSQYGLEAIEKYGIIPEHRKSYGPVRDFLEKQLTLF